MVVKFKGVKRNQQTFFPYSWNGSIAQKYHDSLSLMCLPRAQIVVRMLTVKLFAYLGEYYVASPGFGVPLNPNEADKISSTGRLSATHTHQSLAR